MNKVRQYTSLIVVPPFSHTAFTSCTPQALRSLANEWQNAEMMPDGVALRDVEDDCTALYHTLVDLSPIIMLTWPPGRQPSLGTEGGQPPAREQLLHLEHMGEKEHKWYLKQHEFTTSLQRCAYSPCLPVYSNY
jgi:hypothetical protein